MLVRAPHLVIGAGAFPPVHPAFSSLGGWVKTTDHQVETIHCHLLSEEMTPRSGGYDGHILRWELGVMSGEGVPNANLFQPRSW